MSADGGNGGSKRPRAEEDADANDALTPEEEEAVASAERGAPPPVASAERGAHPWE